jgi:hypothetical protein
MYSIYINKFLLKSVLGRQQMKVKKKKKKKDLHEFKTAALGKTHAIQEKKNFFGKMENDDI